MDTKTLHSKIAAIPAQIRDWYASEKLLDIITDIIERFKISKDNQSAVPKLLLRLAIKDLDAEYFSGELASQLKLDKNNALAITAEIKRTILSPLRKDLSDYGIDIDLLDKFQMPIMKPAEAQATASQPPIGPKIISQTFEVAPNALTAAKMPAPKIPTPAPAPMPKPQPVTSQTAAAFSVGATPLASNKNIPAAPAPQPVKSPLSDKGWSRLTPQDPVVKLGVITPGMPKPAAAPQTAQPKPATAPQKTVSEFDRLDAAKKPAAPIPSSASPTPPPVAPKMPAPVMLHEVSPGATQQSPNFRVNTGMQNQMGKPTMPTSMPVRPIVMEFGSTSKPSSPQPAPPPRPPKPPTPPQDKVIVQDFLGPQK